MLVRHFSNQLNIKISPQQYSRQIGMANNLLKRYSYEQLISVIDYISQHPLKKRIFSISYLSYIADETLDKIRLEELKSKEIDYGEEEKVVNERRVSKSMFKRGVKF
jgi:hypothetical protein